MYNHYTEDDRKAVIDLRYSGATLGEISLTLSIPRSTVHSWVKTKRNVSARKSQEVYRLKHRAEKLEQVLQLLREVSCGPSVPLRERLLVAEAMRGKYKDSVICEALGIANGTYYNFLFRNKRDQTSYAKHREDLCAEIRKIYDENHQIYGAEKITVLLKASGRRASKEMVRELMQNMGLVSIRSSSKKQYDADLRKAKNYLKQKFDVDAPNRVWVGDVTQFNYDQNPYYICAVMDLYSRKIVGYKIGKHNSTQLVKSAFAQAFRDRQPNTGLVFHSDRGSNYRSYAFEKYLKSLHVTHSLSRAGIPYDNSVIESFFKSFKAEELYRTRYHSEREFLSAIVQYMDFYNTKRPHKNNQYLSPDAKEQQYAAQSKAKLDVQIGQPLDFPSCSGFSN